jgi:lipopolysaccharide biosynthesis protein
MKYVILYSYFETQNSINNLLYFVKNGVNKNDENVFYVFVINSNVCKVNIPEYSNIKIIKRNNIGRDFGGWSSGLKYVIDNFSKDYFDKYIFINDTVIGPFLPRYLTNSTKNYLNYQWYYLFCNLLNDKTKLSGLTINYKPMGHENYSKHVQSMMFCTDNIGLNLLISNKILMENENIYESEAKKSKFNYIVKYEIGMSKVILDNGYNISALALSENKKHKIEDVWYNSNIYFKDNVNPLETIFYKNNRFKTNIYNVYMKYFF